MLRGPAGRVCARDPSGTAGGAVAADDAVAGDDEGDRVRGAGLAHLAHHLWLTDGTGDVAVAAGGAAGDLAQGSPDALLEGGARDVGREAEPGLSPSRWRRRVSSRVGRAIGWRRASATVRAAGDAPKSTARMSRPVAVTSMEPSEVESVL